MKLNKKYSALLMSGVILLSTVAPAATASADTAGSAASTAASGISSVINSIGTILKGLGGFQLPSLDNSALQTLITKVANNVIDDINAPIKNLIDSNGYGYANIASATGSGIGAANASVAEATGSELANLIGTPANIRAAVGSAIKTVASDTHTNVNDINKNVINQANSIVSNAIEQANKSITDAGTTTNGYFSKVLNYIADDGHTLADGLAKQIVANLQALATSGSKTSSSSASTSSATTSSKPVTSSSSSVSSTPVSTTTNTTTTTTTNNYYTQTSKATKAKPKAKKSGYYTKVYPTVRVKINKIYGYTNSHLTKRVRSYKKNSIIKIKSIKKYHNKYRYKTAKGDYITTWKKYITY